MAGRCFRTSVLMAFTLGAALISTSGSVSAGAENAKFVVTIDKKSIEIEPGKTVVLQTPDGQLSLLLSVPKEGERLSLSLNDEIFSVTPGKKTTLRSKTEENRSYKVTIERWYPTHEMGPIRFQYDPALALTDDRAPTERMVTLTHTDGFSLSILDARPEKNARKLLEATLQETKKGHAEEGEKHIKSSSPKKVRFEKSAGQSGRVTHVDEDGDTYSDDIFVLESRGNLILVMVGYWETDRKPVYEALQPTLDSLEFKGE